MAQRKNIPILRSTEFLELMVGEAGLREMRSLKMLFDPDGLLNSGNLFPVFTES